MNLQTLTFAQIVRLIATAAQANSTAPLKYDLGSVELALAEADASVAQWLQSLIVQVLATTRASTSSGADLDSWMADFGLTRLPAVSATGQVTFSRATPTNQASIPVGTLLTTPDDVQFTVIADTNQTAYQAATASYIIPAGTASITASVQAVVAGSGGNVLASTITQIAAAIRYVDAVTNAAAITNGIDAESDDAFRARFQLYIGSFEQGTKAAIAYALAAMQQGITYSFVENQTYAGAAQPGYFYVVVDNGTGAPPSSLIDAAGTAIDAVRPLTSTFNVYSPVIVTANIACTVTAQTGYTLATVQAAVVSAITAYVNSLTLGQTLEWSYLYALIYAVPGVQNASGLTVNSATADLTATAQQVIKAGTVTA